MFSKSQSELILSEAEKLYNLPEIRGGYMKYFETDNSNNKILARMENFIEDENLSDFRENLYIPK